MKITSIQTINVGPIPLIFPIIRSLRIRETIDNICPIERKRDEGITHGQVIETLIINRLIAPKPLYGIEEWAEKNIIGHLFKVDSAKLNDFRIARTLDMLVPPKKSEQDKESISDETKLEDKILEVQSQIAMNAITEYNLTSNIIHYDVTSIFFEGDYEENEMITLGYSRDHRKDAKQINLGLNTIDDYAIPISHDVHKGNTADISTVISNMQKLKEIIKSKDLIIVSDRGTVSLKNLLALKNASVRFISTLSLTDNQKKEISLIKNKEFYEYELEYLSEQNKKLKEQGKPYYRYFGKETQITLKGKEGELKPRALVVLSEQKLYKDRKTRKKNLRKIIDGFKDIENKLNKWDYKKKDFVIKKIHDLLYKNKWKKFINYKVEGNDGNIKLSFGLNKEKLKENMRMDGKYMLITDTDSNEFSPSKLLEIYKKQAHLDWRMRSLKRTVKVRPIFLRRDNRIIALVFVCILALMVYSIIELMMEKEEKKLNVDLKPCQRLSAKGVLDIFEKVNLVRYRLQTGRILLMLEDLTILQLEIIKLMGLEHPSKLINGLDIHSP